MLRAQVPSLRLVATVGDLEGTGAGGAQFTDGRYPQMLMRLGCGGHKLTTPRRPVSDTLRTTP